MKKIAIIGATGMIGQPVTKAFVNAGYDVTILTRNAAKAEKIFGKDVKTVEGNLKDIYVIERLLEGQEALYLNLSVEVNSAEKQFQPEREGIDHILEAAKKAGIKRIGYLSSLVHLYQGQNGFKWWVFDIKQQAVEKIKKSGLPYSVFYPSTFMECFDKGGYRQGNFINLSGESKYKLFLIAGTDYGKQVVRAFELNNGNHEYIIQGKEGYIADEAAKVFVEHSANKKVRIMKLPFWLLSLLGNIPGKFNYGKNIIEALNNYPEKFEAGQTWKDLGEPFTKFTDYAKNAR